MISKNLWGLNPNFKEILDKKPSLTLIGLWWSMYWRMAIIMTFVTITIWIVIGIVSKLIF